MDIKGFDESQDKGERRVTKKSVSWAEFISQLKAEFEMEPRPFPI
jgi:hypothetical protein